MGGLTMKPAAWRHRGEKEKAPLHYTDCGLDGVYLVSGYELENTPYGEGLSVKNLDQLHEAIGRYLASQKKGLSGKELRFLRKQMDLTQGELGKLLGLTSQQVARWEKEESDISGPADLLVRTLFLEHVGKKINVQALAESLEEIDERASNEKMYFENTAEGWKKAA
jgi:putative transcriptional regulator